MPSMTACFQARRARSQPAEVPAGLMKSMAGRLDQALPVGNEAAGVVIDDAAVTPGYVTGLKPARELPIIWNITKGSLKNKLLILLPGALLLSWLLPQAIVFVLMAGGCYLSFEGAEKVMEKLGGKKHGETLEDEIEDPAKFEKERTAGAIRTDLILSAVTAALATTARDAGRDVTVVTGRCGRCGCRGRGPWIFDSAALWICITQPGTQQ